MNVEDTVKALRAISQDYENGNDGTSFDVCGECKNAADQLEQLNDFEQSQCAILLRKIARLEAENDKLKERLSKAAELPCMVGDTVWHVASLVNGMTIIAKGIIYAFYKTVNCDKDQIYFKDDPQFHNIWLDIDAFGKTLFLTEAEAQAKLDELKGGATT